MEEDDHKEIKKELKPDRPTKKRAMVKKEKGNESEGRGKKQAKVEKSQVKEEIELPSSSVKEEIYDEAPTKAKEETKEENEDVPAEEAQANQKGKRGRKKLDPNRPVREKKEKKVFELPGQKYDPPEEREGIRIFYESLYNQRPSSEMAQIWMMEHGLLSKSEAEAVLQLVKLKKGNLAISNGKKVKPEMTKTEIPAKASGAPKLPQSRKSVKEEKNLKEVKVPRRGRKKEESDSDF